MVVVATGLEVVRCLLALLVALSSGFCLFVFSIFPLFAVVFYMAALRLFVGFFTVGLLICSARLSLYLQVSGGWR